VIALLARAWNGVVRWLTAPDFVELPADALERGQSAGEWRL
jgi:hypothetical protein